MGYQNFFATRLASDAGSSDNILTLESAPSVTTGKLVLEARNPTQREIVSYLGVSGNQVTGVTRGLGGTTAKPHTKNALVEMNVTAEDLTAALALAFAFPTGIVLPHAGSIVPSGWLSCDGSLVSRTTYAELFTAIGINFGAGDGSTTFKLPDMRGRVPLGAGQGVFTETVVQSTAVNASTDEITVSAAAYKQFIKSTPVVVTSSVTAPGGLTSGNTYYVIPVGSNKIKLATTRGNTGVNYGSGFVAIDITSTGSGNLTFTLTLTSRTLAELGGEETHLQTQDEVGDHLHMIGVGPSAGGYPDANGVVTSGAGADRVGGQRSVANLAQNGYRGATNGMNILQPFVGLNYIIKA